VPGGMGTLAVVGISSGWKLAGVDWVYADWSKRLICSSLDMDLRVSYPWMHKVPVGIKSPLNSRVDS